MLAFGYKQREVQVVAKVVVLFSKMKCFTVVHVVSRTLSHYRLTPIILVAVSLICSWSSAGASHSRPTRQNECGKSVLNRNSYTLLSQSLSRGLVLSGTSPTLPTLPGSQLAQSLRKRYVTRSTGMLWIINCMLFCSIC